jgi:hypothetical protein
MEIKRKYDPEHVFVVGGGPPLSISEPDAKEWGLSPTLIEGPLGPVRGC